MTRSLSIALLSLVTSGLLVSQQPGTTPTAPPAKGDELRRAFVDADGGRRIAIVAAADAMLQGGPDARAKFLGLLRAVVAVAPAPAPTPPAGAGSQPAAGGTGTAGAPPAAEKPADLPEATRAAMSALVTGPVAEAPAALAKLAEDKEHGAAALTRLAERGRLIFARGVNTIVRKKIETNALFAGQYSDLADLKPEVVELLLGWVKEPPRDVTRTDNFQAACVRALRDLVPAAEATEGMRKGLQAALAKSQHGGGQLFIAIACALHQFGVTEPFDQIKAQAQKGAAAEKDEEKGGALQMLADLHYQLRQYDVAAGYYQNYLALAEKMPKPPQNLATTIYNTACCLSLAQKLDEGFAMLEKALQTSKATGAGPEGVTKGMIDSDHDMNNLRADPRFQKLMDQYFGAGSKPAK